MSSYLAFSLSEKVKEIAEIACLNVLTQTFLIFRDVFVRNCKEDGIWCLLSIYSSVKQETRHKQQRPINIHEALVDISRL